MGRIFHLISGLLYLQGIEEWAQIDGNGVSPFFSDILSISRGIFKWLCQQQVVNPFFKGSSATVRFEVARVKRIPSGNLLFSFTLSLAEASFRFRQALTPFCFLRSPRLDTSQPTFARFPITPFPSLFHCCERSPQRLHGLRGEKKDFLSLEIRCSILHVFL